MEAKVPDKKIDMVWFTQSHIYIKTDDGLEFCQPLEVFPALKAASREQRERYRLSAWRDSLRWPEIDEDIHISNFFERETVNYDNEVNNLLSRFPWLDLKEFASYLGMHWTKLARFKYGVWTPSPETLSKIKDGIVAIGREMSAAAI